MKRIFCLILALALVFCGCQVGDPDEITTDPTTGTTEYVPAVPEALRENFPTMDGSTSLIPLEAGIRAAIFDISIEEATAQVSHTTTWQSFQNLLDSTVDVIFSVDLSQEQLDRAGDANVELEIVPIAMEGFVFVVNAQNPVDSLTQEQIRGIYSGQITNWAQVGGNDEVIIPYQRNADSGSQNYMTAFMDDTPLMDAPTELRPASMSGLMDVIAVNDHSTAAIGYSVYAYAADMYGNGNEIKFIQVDGVAPSKATFASRDYPLLGYNYMIFRSDEPTDGPVWLLADWLRSRDGQTAIARAGYVTAIDIGYDYAEATLDKYQGVGSGPSAGDIPSSEYALYTLEETDWGTNCHPLLIPEVITHSDGTRTYRITQLVNTALQDEINAWIDEQMIWAAAERPALEALLEELNRGYSDDWNVYQYGLPWSVQQPDDMDAACIVTAKNGYLSAAISLCYTYNVQDGRTFHYKTETATWDLISGQRISIEDLFCQGVDIDEVLGEYIRTYSMDVQDEFSGYPELKRDFAGLTTSGWHMTIDTIYFDHDNPYFVYGEFIDLDKLPDNVMVTEQLRDFSDCLDSGSNVSSVRQFRISNRDLVYTYTADQLLSFSLLREDIHPDAASINTYVTNYLNTYYTEDAIRGYYDRLGYNGDDVELFWLDWYLSNWGGRYLHFNGYSVEYYDKEYDEFIHYPYSTWILYDLQTGTHISWEDLLMDGWEDAAVWDDGLMPDDWTSMNVDWFYLENGHQLRVRFTRDYKTYYYVSIPADYIIY